MEEVEKTTVENDADHLIIENYGCSDGNINVIEGDRELKSNNLHEEVHTSTPETNATDLKSQDETENESGNLEDFIVPMVFTITPTDSILDESKIVVHVDEENSQLNAEASTTNTVNPPTIEKSDGVDQNGKQEEVQTEEETKLQDSESSIISSIKTSLVDSILRSCQFDETKQISAYVENRLKNEIDDSFPDVKIDKVVKLSNKYLYAAFMLKKSEKKNYNISELIHSTAAENVSSIEKENLDWRLVRRTKYGYGVSFSTNADYANYYSSWSGGNRRAFIICDVLVDSVENVADNNCDVPNGSFDTFRSHNNYVYVKFDDFTIYPKYALYYNKPSDHLSSFYRKRKYY